MKEVVKKVKKMTKSFTTSSRQTIIVGGSEVGVQLAERLIQMGQDVVMIEEDARLRKQIQERIDVLTLQGEGTDLDVLTKAGIDKTNLLIALTGDDRKNLLTGIYAQQLGVKDIIVQVKQIKNLAPKLQLDKLELDLVVNPSEMVIKRVKNLIKPGMKLEVDQYLNKKVQISEFKISHQSNFAYNTVNELNLPDNSLILVIARKGRVIIPQGKDKIYPGDSLYIICPKGFKKKFGRLLTNYADDKEKIVLVGEGEVNYQLAKSFASHAVVTIIEEDLKKCERLADSLEDVLVLQGSGADVDLLKEEGVAKADAFVAVTDDDDANLVMAVLAKKLGVKKSIAVVDKINYSYLTEFLRIDHIICPSLITIDTILDFLHQGQVDGMVTFGGQVKFSKVTYDRQGITKIKDLNLPTDLIVGLIYRGKKVIIPTGTTRLEPKDDLLVFSLATKEEIEHYFK
ncbi:Trk system potassium transporter TrkA [Natroniella sulfidigena]|uniref:Trk system potassium transporter TrkA n=1 Tax=Natroniella sulfidigena TaxID=723921 RepID=UPI00200AAA27|nr:Trk system potassium transporter TrkA [Natroniella sulfidigena]MCK8817662.1 Trk system potassium transporter TrkA [Natroniella sulfidigena]